MQSVGFHRCMWSDSGLSSRFIGTGVQYCFTRNLHSYSTNFYFSYFLRVMMGALACIFICLSVNHFGRRGMLLLSAIITGLSSLLLLALTQCMLHPHVSLINICATKLILHQLLPWLLEMMSLFLYNLSKQAITTCLNCSKHQNNNCVLILWLLASNLPIFASLDMKETLFFLFSSLMSGRNMGLDMYLIHLELPPCSWKYNARAIHVTSVELGIMPVLGPRKRWCLKWCCS